MLRQPWSRPPSGQRSPARPPSATSRTSARCCSRPIPSWRRRHCWGATASADPVARLETVVEHFTPDRRIRARASRAAAPLARAHTPATRSIAVSPRPGNRLVRRRAHATTRPHDGRRASAARARDPRDHRDRSARLADRRRRTLARRSSRDHALLSAHVGAIRNHGRRDTGLPPAPYRPRESPPANPPNAHRIALPTPPRGGGRADEQTTPPSATSRRTGSTCCPTCRASRCRRCTPARWSPRARRPDADLPDGADRAGGLGRARDRDPRRGARRSTSCGARRRCSARAAWSARSTPRRHIYYKYEGVSPAGSHKPNTAVAQAYENAQAGIKRLATETGAGQWGSSLAFACSALRPGVRGLHGRLLLRPEALPPLDDGDLGRDRAPLAEPPTGPRPAARSRAPDRLARHRDLRGRRGRGRRRHQLRARLGAQPRAAAPDRDRPGGGGADGDGRRGPRRRRRLRRRRLELRRPRVPVRAPRPARRGEARASSPPSPRPARR